MLKKYLVPLAVLLLIPSLYSLIPKSSGSPGGKTGSLADIQTCTQCHSGTNVPATDWISADIPEGGYMPNETYTITLTGDHNGVSRFGFELTAEDISGIKKGTFIISDAAQTKLVNNNQSVTHTSSGLSPNGTTKNWSFNWTAPEEGSGEITFFAALNAADGNYSTSGDVIYTSNLSVNENTGSGIDNVEADENIFKVYQTPDPNILMVDFSEQNQKIKNIQIFDISGKLLVTRDVSRLRKGPESFNIQAFNTNIYLIKIQTDKNYYSKKILINK